MACFQISRNHSRHVSRRNGFDAVIKASAPRAGQLTAWQGLPSLTLP
jgi:hypothetical protein